MQRIAGKIEESEWRWKCPKVKFLVLPFCSIFHLEYMNEITTLHMFSIMIDGSTWPKKTLKTCLASRWIRHKVFIYDHMLLLILTLIWWLHGLSIGSICSGFKCTSHILIRTTTFHQQRKQKKIIKEMKTRTMIPNRVDLMIQWIGFRYDLQSANPWVFLIENNSSICKQEGSLTSFFFLFLPPNNTLAFLCRIRERGRVYD